MIVQATDLRVESKRWLPAFGRHNLAYTILMVSGLFGYPFDVLQRLGELDIGGIVDRTMLEAEQSFLLSIGHDSRCRSAYAAHIQGYSFDGSFPV